ncbi:hypothetical protein P8452_31932 [Trifolium repens]|jgi:hypothetical protein|nr:hypothetical protein P8452_31932 [Trifolium repens]
MHSILAVQYNLEKLATQFFCISLWKIWKARCDRIFNNFVITVLIVEYIANFLEEFNVANLGTSPLSIPHEASKWKASVVNTLKINVDAGFMREMGTPAGL